MFSKKIFGIVPSFDMFKTDNGYLFEVQEYIPDAVTLEDSIMLPETETLQTGNMSFSSRLGKAEELVQLIRDIHDTGTAHGDISSENIIQESDGSLHLVDFESTTFSDTRVSQTAQSLKQTADYIRRDKQDLMPLIASIVFKENFINSSFFSSSQNLAELLFDKWQSEKTGPVTEDIREPAITAFKEFAETFFDQLEGKQDLSVLEHQLKKLNSRLSALEQPFYLSIITEPAPGEKLKGPFTPEEIKDLDSVLEDFQLNPEKGLDARYILMIQAILKQAHLDLDNFLPDGRDLDQNTLVKSVRAAMILARSLVTIYRPNINEAAGQTQSQFWRTPDKIALAESFSRSIEAAKDPKSLIDKQYQFERVLLENNRVFDLIDNGFDPVSFMALLPYKESTRHNKAYREDMTFLLENQHLPLKDLLILIEEKANSKDNPFKNPESASELKKLAVFSRLKVGPKANVPPLAVLYFSEMLADKIREGTVSEDILVLEGDVLDPVMGGEQGESVLDFNRIKLAGTSIAEFFRDTEIGPPSINFNIEILRYGYNRDLVYDLFSLVVGNLPATDAKGQVISQEYVISEFLKKHIEEALDNSKMDTMEGRAKARRQASVHSRRRFEKDRALVEQAERHARYADFVNMVTEAGEKPGPEKLPALAKTAKEILKLDDPHIDLSDKSSDEIVLLALQKGVVPYLQKAGLLADLIKRLSPGSRSVQFFLNGIKTLNDKILGMTLANVVQKRFYETHRLLFSNILGHKETNTTFKSIGFAERARTPSVTKLKKGFYKAGDKYYFVDNSGKNPVILELDQAEITKRLGLSDIQELTELEETASSFDVIEKANAQIQHVMQKWSTELEYEHSVFDAVYAAAQGKNGLIEPDPAFSDREDAAILEFALTEAGTLLPAEALSTVSEELIKQGPVVWVAGQKKLVLSKPDDPINDQQIRERFNIYNKQHPDKPFNLTVRVGASRMPLDSSTVTDPKTALALDEEGTLKHEASINSQIKALIEASVQGRIQSIYKDAGARFQRRFINKIVEDNQAFMAVLDDMTDRLWGISEEESMTINGKKIYFSSKALEIIRKGKINKLYKALFGTETPSDEAKEQMHTVKALANEFFKEVAAKTGYLEASSPEEYSLDAFRSWLDEKDADTSFLSPKAFNGIYEFAIVERMFDFREVLDDFTVPRNPLELKGQAPSDQVKAMVNYGLIDTITSAADLTDRIRKARAGYDNVSELLQNIARLDMQKLLMNDPRSPGIDSEMAFASKVEKGSMRFDNTEQQYMVGFADLRGFAEMNHWHYEALLQEIMEEQLSIQKPVPGEENYDEKLEAYLDEIDRFYGSKFVYDLLSDAVKRTVKKEITTAVDVRKFQVLIQALLLKDNASAEAGFLTMFPQQKDKIAQMLAYAKQHPRGPPLSELKSILTDILAQQQREPQAFFSEMIKHFGLSNNKYVIFNDQLFAVTGEEKGFLLEDLFSETVLREGGDEIYFAGPLFTNELLMSLTDFQNMQGIPGTDGVNASLRVMAVDPSSLSFQGKAHIKGHLAMALAEGRMTDTSKSEIEAPYPDKKAMVIRRNTYSETGDQAVRFYTSLDYTDNTVDIEQPVDYVGEKLFTRKFSKESQQKIVNYLLGFGFPANAREDETADSVAKLIIDVQNGNQAQYDAEDHIRENQTLMRFMGFKMDKVPDTELYPVLERLINQAQQFERLKQRPEETALQNWDQFVTEFETILRNVVPYLNIKTIQKMIKDMPEYVLSKTTREQYRVYRRMLYNVMEMKTKNNSFAAKNLVRQALVTCWFSNRGLVNWEPSMPGGIMQTLRPALVVSRNTTALLAIRKAFLETESDTMNISKTMGWLFDRKTLESIFGETVAQQLFPEVFPARDIGLGTIDDNLLDTEIRQIMRNSEESYSQKTGQIKRFDDPAFIERTPYVTTEETLIINGPGLLNAAKKRSFKGYHEQYRDALPEDVRKTVEILVQTELLLQEKIQSLKLSEAAPEEIEIYSKMVKELRQTRFVFPRNNLFLIQKDTQNLSAIHAGRDRRSVYMGLPLLFTVYEAGPDQIAAGIVHELAHIFKTASEQQAVYAANRFNPEANSDLMDSLHNIAEETRLHKDIVDESLFLETDVLASFLNEILAAATNHDIDQIADKLDETRQEALFKQGLYERIFSKENLTSLPQESTRLIGPEQVSKWIDNEPELMCPGTYKIGNIVGRHPFQAFSRCFR